MCMIRGSNLIHLEVNFLVRYEHINPLAEEVQATVIANTSVAFESGPSSNWG